MWWSSSSGRIGLNITLADARTCSHAGDCEADVLDLMTKPSVRRQLAKVDPADLRDYLGEYGAWDEPELADHDANLKRLVWLACCDLAEEHGR